MPVKSAAQERLMQAVRHNPAFAEKVGISKSVADKFVGPKAHAEGGTVKKESPAMMKKEVSFMKKKGAPKSMIKHEMAEMKSAKKPVKKMMRGGSCK
jgi:hypothetical protein